MEYFKMGGEGGHTFIRVDGDTGVETWIHNNGPEVSDIDGSVIVTASRTVEVRPSSRAFWPEKFTTDPEFKSDDHEFDVEMCSFANYLNSMRDKPA